MIEAIDELDKDGLEEFVKDENIDYKIDKRKGIDLLRKEIKAMFVQSVEVVNKKAAQPKSGFLKNPKTGNIFHWTVELSKQENLVECDENGNEI